MTNVRMSEKVSSSLEHSQLWDRSHTFFFPAVERRTMTMLAVYWKKQDRSDARMTDPKKDSLILITINISSKMTAFFCILPVHVYHHLYTEFMFNMQPPFTSEFRALFVVCVTISITLRITIS